jgi:2-dehydro-3-deoxyphosphogluconate aldolase/(4S)-4-hydroxy-2-oxoglutarate aldolase
MRILAEDPNLLVGAGTVLRREDVHQVAGAGGRFALSPVFDPDVVAEAHRSGLLAVPGAATPAEILAAHRSGARIVKVFPAAALGGPAYLRAIRGPLPHIPLLPTNGPTSMNLHDYFAAGASAVGVGGEVFHEGFTFEGITAAAARIRKVIDAV